MAQEEETTAEGLPSNSISSLTASGKQLGSLSGKPNAVSAPKHHATVVTLRDFPKALSAEMTWRPLLNRSSPEKFPAADLPNTLIDSSVIPSPPACHW